MTVREQFYYSEGYAQGKIDFAKELAERIGCIKTCYCDEYDSGVDYAVHKAYHKINEMVGDSDGRE